MKYMLVITGPIYGNQNSITGLLFARNLFSSGNTISSIFFYCNGVTNASINYSPNHNEFNLLQAWIDLYKKFRVKLKICTSAALRRGIVPNNKKNIGQILIFFKFIGLIEIVQEMKNCDRIIQF